MTARFFSFFSESRRTFLRDQDGSVLVYVALLLPIIIGFGGLSLDIGSWYKIQQDAQIAADAGATAGAWEVGNGSASTVVSAATTDVGLNGFAGSGTKYKGTITVNNPPKSGSYAGNANAVEVIVSTPVSSLLSSVILKSTFNIASRAVALVSSSPGTGGGTACLLALDPTMSGAITMNGNLKANFQNCTIASDSNSSSSVFINGNVTVTANSIYSGGGISQGNNDTLHLSSPAMTHQIPIPDPYKSTSVPSYGGCDQTNFSPNGNNVTLSPGVYCGGISLQKDAVMNPGTYYLTNGNFTANAQSNVTCNCSHPGDGVTIVLTGTSPGGVTLNGGAVLNLQAPSGNSSNPLDGFLFYQDRNASVGNSVTFNGSSAINLTGTLYFPKAAFTWNGDSTSNPPSCTQIVADSVKLNGNTTITDAKCSTQGAGTISTAQQVVGVSLVE